MRRCGLSGDHYLVETLRHLRDATCALTVSPCCSHVRRFPVTTIEGKRCAIFKGTSHAKPSIGRGQGDRDPAQRGRTVEGRFRRQVRDRHRDRRYPTLLGGGYLVTPDGQKIMIFRS